MVEEGGKMISRERFIVSKSADEQGWLDARGRGVTATAVAEAASGASGFGSVMKSWVSREPVVPNDYMRFGSEAEDWIMAQLPVPANDWLICSEEDARFMATPDGISDDGTILAEVKTTGTDWGSWAKTPIKYRRQVQWQLFVAGEQATSCVFAWMLRESDQFGKFVPAWMSPATVIVERDEAMIEHLKVVATELLKEMNL